MIDNRNIMYKEKNLISYIIKILLGILFFILSKLLLKEDFTSFLSWWFVLLLLGITFLPVTSILFSKFYDNGYLFSKTVGLAVSGYLMWFLSSIKLVKFNSASCILIIFICAIMNSIIVFRAKKKHIAIVDKNKLSLILTEEILFLALFLIWTYIRGFKPEAYGTEKFMDFGFMAAMMRSEYMPPKDLWFAGNTINYYYVGQYMAVFLTKLSFVSVKVGYNLMLMTVGAFAFVLPFSLVYNVTKHYFVTKNVPNKISPAFAGILSGAGVLLAGNMHFPLYYWIIPILRTLLGIKSEEDGSYWFPDSTRYIGYDPDTTDKTIHEFPNYSIVLGDLHAHVINIIFVLTVLAVLYGWLTYCKSKKETYQNQQITLKTQIIETLVNPYIILISFFIGLFHMTNFWDFPIYYVVAGAIILFSNLVLYRFSLKVVWKTAMQGIEVMLLAKLFALPFTLNFDQISTQIYLTTAHTPLYQLIILWGLPVTLVIGFFFELTVNHRIQVSRDLLKKGVNKTGVKKYTGYKPIPNFKKFLNELTISDLFVLTAGLCAIGLVFIPEVVYVKDIYSGDYKRANTMFKLTYQAFIIFGVCSGYILLKFIKIHKFRWQKKFTIICLLLFLSSLWYSKISIQSWYGNIFNTAGYKGLDATAYLATQMPDDYEATNWINENIDGTPVILEANGDSYSDNGRVSVTTGLPTVLGWYVHEWLWRGGTAILDERAADIQTIYTSADMNQVVSLIDKYDISYIYVGKLERDKYSAVNDNMLKNLGDVVFSIPEREEKPYETYIIKIAPKG